MSDDNLVDRGFRGHIRSTRLANGQVRIEMETFRDRCHMDLTVDEARKFAQGVLYRTEPLTETGAAALAADRARSGGNHG